MIDGCTLNKEMNIWLTTGGIVRQEFLEQWLARNGYTQSNLTTGLWKHHTRLLQFCLDMDGFGVKYIGREYTEHLHQILAEWGGKYVGLTLDWDYKNKKVHISMQGYTQKALMRFNPQQTQNPQHWPYSHVPPNYGQKIQYTIPEDTAPLLDQKQMKNIQEVTGIFIYYAQAADSILLTMLNNIPHKQYGIGH